MNRLFYTARVLLLSLCFFFAAPASGQHIKEDQSGLKLLTWKFKTGNDAAWSRPDFDDSGWENMPVPAHWEEHGYPEYDGFAVYRSKIVIPSSFKKPHMLGLRFEMGAIDDVDSVFVNGHFIGGLHDFRLDRIYYVLYNEGVIRWDKENVVVVKVLDKYGWGGMYKGVPTIKNASQNEFVAFDQNLHEWETLKANKIRKKISLRAKRNVEVNGILTISLLDVRNNKLKKLSAKRIVFSNKQHAKDSVDFVIPEQRSFKLIYKFIGAGSKEGVKVEESIPYILTPDEPLIPRINGAEVFAVRPGSPVIYRIPASGVRPMQFGVENLPAGLSLDVNTGIITGKIVEKGNYEVLLKAKNLKGTNTKKFRFVCGDRLALTPPMGWNSWNAWGVRVDQKKIMAAGDELVAKGLADYGWSYINIDDAWQSSVRGIDGEILANDNFPDMKGLTDYLHNNGLKAGLYSSPGPLTCAGYTGSIMHEEQDANAWAKWGFDFVKYDLCSYQNLFPSRNPDSLKKPYDLLGGFLKKQNRDILYSLCQYGWGEVWKWGDKTGGSLWRTGDDIEDTWESVSSIGFNQRDKAGYSAPGSWNDLDMLVVGRVGWGYPRNSRLTPDEQYTHIGLWSMLASPLLIGADLAHLDAFTKNLLCNHEVIAINQDVLGIQAVPIYDADSIQIFSKRLNDGTTAIGIINLSEKHLQYGVTAEMMGLKGRFRMRDLWRQKDIGFHDARFKAELPAHGILLLKCTVESEERRLKIENWKFKTGTKPAWLLPGFDDSSWPQIKIAASWESQGYDEYNGFAIYRSEINIPSTLKTSACEGLCFEMGAIDDADSVFVNGHFIGSTNVFTADRFYFVHNNSKIIKWDGPNVVAVKVFDETGWGGMYKGIPAIRPASRKEFIEMNYVPGEWKMKQREHYEKEVKFSARAGTNYTGKLNVYLLDVANGKRELKETKIISFSQKRPFLMTLKFNIPKAAPYQLVYSFVDKISAEISEFKEDVPYLLTPEITPAPKIGGALVYGTRPGSPILYRIAATGVRPMHFTVKDLPKGLYLDPEKGIISGSLSSIGTYRVKIGVNNLKGTDTRELLFKVGDTLALTPPMGWNSWNVWGVKVDGQKVKDAAKAMVDEGLADFGWTYINIDDGWQGERRENGGISSGSHFLDMEDITSYIHKLGLKAGIYSSPGPKTCGVFTGSYGFEANDASQWAKWGFDYLKYDLCSYQDVMRLKNDYDIKHPYYLMGDLLKKKKRDIVFSMCQYGIDEVWKWGADTGGNLWRTSEDITDTWESILHLGFNMYNKAAYAGPGQWNDPDMLVVGRLGWGNLRNSALTPDEQYTHVSLWSIQASPLLIGCEIAGMDVFTKNLLCNHEVIAVNQDPLGVQGERIYHSDEIEVYSKPLYDGGTAIAVFNLKPLFIKRPLELEQLGLKGNYKLIDLWRQETVRYDAGILNANIPGHGVLFLKAIPDAN